MTVVLLGAVSEAVSGTYRVHINFLVMQVSKRSAVSRQLSAKTRGARNPAPLPRTRSSINSPFSLVWLIAES
jgi:hypothetical protein